MKICVLFGSFNPLTKAHIAAMKTAVNAIRANLGLFVATNGQYLKRKTVKIDDPFYLSEDERKSIIDQVCATEPNFEFACFELGGINPSRFKTLCKIQKQYPGAEIYEIQVADKVHALLKSSHAEEYVGNFRFIVFERFGIDLDAMFRENPALNQLRESFVILPPLDEISSIEVRRRFFAGEDYSDIVPASAVEVLGRHQPSDFAISFTERMQTLVKSGRFGVNAAQKEVYADNNQLFARWKNGENEAYFGNYQEFLDNTTLVGVPLIKF